ncbi:MAG: arylsulfotransferase family protein [Actinomycetota bacterium]|nr:arylsulfotransferase family protein [Actinomycetota bacterium]
MAGPSVSDDNVQDVPAQSGNRHTISRRRLLLSGGGGAIGIAALAGSAFGGIRIGSSNASHEQSSAPATPPEGDFKTRPGLIPPRLQVVDLDAGTASGLVMLTPSLLPGVRGLSQAQAVAKGKGQMGVMIANNRGEVIWFQPTTELATNLQVQSYRGQPVLTFWNGQIVNGMGYGKGYLLDHQYQTIATIKAGNGLEVDLHELTLTPQNTALVTAYRKSATDVSAIGGPKNGSVFEGVIQEIDIATGKVLFQWNSLDHVPVTDSYTKATGDSPVDYFHINSVALWDDNSLLVSARNTWTVYRIDRRSGAIIWRLGGKRSNFAIEKGANFEWQHHVRRYNNGITVFDDAATPAEEPQSRALVLAVDESAKKVSLTKAYTHPAKLLTYYEGSIQMLANGNAFVGWGTEPYSSEFDPNGNLIYDVRFPTNDQSYRAFRYEWTGTPASPPQLVVDQDAIGGYAAYVSWNGATNVAYWQVLAGSSAKSLEPVAVVPKAGFETAITVHPGASYVAVAGLDLSGKRLGISAPAKV